MASESVWVGLKWPNGLILRTFIMVKVQEAQLGGGTREFDQAQPKETVTIKGYNTPSTNAEIVQVSVMPRFAFTEVPAAFMAEWIARNKDNGHVKAGLLVVGKSLAEARSMAAANEKALTGREPIDPGNLPKTLRTGATFSKADTDDARAA